MVSSGAHATEWILGIHYAIKRSLEQNENRNLALTLKFDQHQLPVDIFWIGSAGKLFL